MPKFRCINGHVVDGMLFSCPVCKTTEFTQIDSKDSGDEPGGRTKPQLPNERERERIAAEERERIAAWSKIGEIDGVDAFKRKTEVTHITKSGKELEEELKKTIEELKGKVIDGEIVEDDDD